MNYQNNVFGLLCSLAMLHVNAKFYNHDSSVDIDSVHHTI